MASRVRALVLEYLWLGLGFSVVDVRIPRNTRALPGIRPL